MKTTVLIAVFLLASLPRLACAELSFPTQEEAQHKFDAAVSDADTATVEHVWTSLVRMPDESLRHISVCEIKGKKEIQALSKYVQLIIPPPAKKLENGREFLVYRIIHFDTYGDFTIELKKAEKTLLVFEICGDPHAHYIACDALVKDSWIEVEQKALAPLLQQLTDLLKNKPANQAPEPTPTTVTPPAGQEARQP